MIEDAGACATGARGCQHRCRVRQYLGDDRAGADDHVIANRHWQNGGIGADADMITNLSGAPKIRYSDLPGRRF